MRNRFISLLVILLSYTQLLAQDAEIVFTTKLENLGNKVNSEFSEAEPKISPDGKTLYICRRNDPTNIGGGFTGPDVWFSELLPDGTWSEAKNLGEPVNDEFFNQVIGIRSDGNAMLLKGKYDAVLKTDIYISFRSGNKWNKPIPQEFENFDYNPEGSSYSVSVDFKVLISAYAPATGREDDLFVSFLQRNGKWSKPVFMGETLNTTQEEVFPTLAGDGVTLYFSSRGHEGYGDHDIYVSRRLDDTWTNWSKPKNLGSVINTSGYDSDFIVDTKGKYAYLSSNADISAGFDIFRIELPASARPNPVTMVTGTVVDGKTMKPIEATITYVRSADGIELGKVTSNSVNGVYNIVLPYGQKYSFLIEAKSYLSESETLDLTKVSEYQEVKKDLQLLPDISVNRANQEFGYIFFEFGAFEIRPEFSPKLVAIIDKLNENPNSKVSIIGHTDNVGTDEKNLELSKQRAQAVADNLIAKGVDKKRIVVAGVGESQPAADNTTERGRLKNRRVEFKFL